MTDLDHAGHIAAMARESHSHRLRIGRHSLCGGIYLLTACCDGRVPYFADPAAASIVLEVLHWLDRAGRIDLLAAVVMPDHLHFVGILCHGSLAKAMHALKGYSAARIHRECGSQGRVWQVGYHDRALRTEQAVDAAVWYCLQNPVRAGVVEDFREYPHLWCGGEQQSRL